MDKRMIRTALVGGVCATAAMLAVACSSGSKKKTPTNTLPPPVEKSNTGSPANFACNHSFSDGPAEATTNQTFHLVIQSTTTQPGIAGMSIVMTNPLTASTSGNPVYMTASSGLVAIPVPGNSRLSWKNRAPAGLGGSSYVDTYEFNRLTLTTSAALAGGRVPTRIITTSAYTALSQLATGGTAIPSGSAQMAGAVTDCDGDNVKNAQVVISGATPCSNTPVTFPCVAYFRSGLPNRQATVTDVDGQFLLLGAPTGTISVAVVGTTSGTQTAVGGLGSLDVAGVADSVSLGATSPLSN